MIEAAHPTAPAGYRATDGAAYERFLGRWTRRLAVAFADFASPGAEGAVLDIGCGTGSLAAEIAKRDPARLVVGGDAATAYLSAAAGLHPLPNLRLQPADASSLPFAAATFGAALAQLVLNFVPDPAVAVSEMIRVTRPGGVVAACVWDFAGGLVYQRLLWDTLAGIDADAAAVRDRLFSHPLGVAGGLTDLFARHGIAAIETGSLTIRMDYASFADYWEPLVGGQGPVGTYVASLAGVRREAARDLVRAAYLSGRADGPRSLTATAWAVRGLVPLG